MSLDLATLFSENDFFQGGLVLAAIGAVWTALYKHGLSAFKWLLHRFAVTVIVDNQSQLFEALGAWLDETNALDTVKRLRYESQRMGDFLASPGGGMHLIRILGRRVFFHREINEEKSMWGRPRETFTLTIPFIPRKGVERWLLDVMDTYERRSVRVPMVWNWRRGCWGRIRRVPERPLETVSLSGSKLSDLLDDIRGFLNSREEYRMKGIPWRRGYLFYGKPGTGKSTTAVTLANETRMSVAYLSLAATGLDDSALINAITDLPKHTILLLEDIDAVIPDRDKRKRKKKKVSPGPESSEDPQSVEEAGVTLSGLLNALDGIVTPDGMVVIMTTNYPERLDSALLRPGRADYPVEFDLADVDEAKEIVSRITGDSVLVEAIEREVDEHGPIAHAFIQQAALGAKAPQAIHEILYKARYEKPGTGQTQEGASL